MIKLARSASKEVVLWVTGSCHLPLQRLGPARPPVEMKDPGSHPRARSLRDGCEPADQARTGPRRSGTLCRTYGLWCSWW